MTNQPIVIFGGAELPWIYPLGVELARFGPTSLIRVDVSFSLARRALSWPFDDSPTGLSKTVWTFPPGFNGKLSFLFARSIRSRLDRVVHDLEERYGTSPYVIIPVPSFEPYTSNIEGAKLAYLNYDDFSTYSNTGHRHDNPFERALVERAGTILCSSRYQSDSLRQRFPEKEDAFWHLPHGVHECFLNRSPDDAPARDTVCIVGALTARYDWALIQEVVARLPAVEFSFCGEVSLGQVGLSTESWQGLMRDVLQRSNVRHIRGLSYRDTASVFWNSSANWMPYNPDLPFVKACCPLKLAGGLPSGRPMVSADVPECRLYPEWISIYRNADEAVTLITEALRTKETPRARERYRRQIEFAREHTWAARARTLVEILGRHEGKRSERVDSGRLYT